MKRLIIILASFFVFGGLAFAGGPIGPEQFSVPIEVVTDPNWLQIIGIAVTGVSAVAAITGLYLKYGRKKKQ